LDPDRSLQTHLRSAVHAMDQSSQRRGARQADDEKGSAEMLGDLMSGFFEQSRAMLDPTSKNIPPPQLRENLAQKLRAGAASQSKPATVRQPRRGSLSKAARLRMEAELMAAGPSAAPQVVPQPTRSPPANNSSMSPPDTPGDEQLRPIQTHSQKIPSPSGTLDNEIKGTDARNFVRPRTNSNDTRVVRCRATSKEERKAEEKELMEEFRRQELSTWMDSDSGADAEAVTFDPDVRFVPYRPYVKSR